MIEIKELKHQIFIVRIFEPRELNDEIQFLDSLEVILQNKNFGLILSVEGQSTFSIQSKKQLNFWFKSKRQQLRDRCFGLVRINKDATKMAKLKSKAMGLAMPCMYRVVDNLEGALEFLEKYSKKN